MVLKHTHICRVPEFGACQARQPSSTGSGQAELEEASHRVFLLLVTVRRSEGRPAGQTTSADWLRGRAREREAPPEMLAVTMRKHTLTLTHTWP